ncbi:MAG: glycosyltransferase family 4 protein [Verrucomicrobiales bacterium]
MNLLFVNYGDWDNNSGLQIQSLARALAPLGYDARVVVPKIREESPASAAPGAAAVHHREVLKIGAGFADGRPADVIHAWTPREVVRKFCRAYLEIHPGTPVVVHLEDNEELLLTRFLGRPVDSLPRDESGRLDASFLVPGLIHPDLAKPFLESAAAVTAIHRSLFDMPLAVEGCHELVPVIHADDYSQSDSSANLRHRFGVGPDEKVVVYVGNDHFANREDVRTLYAAVHALNQRGSSWRLFRTGKIDEATYEGLPFDRDDFETRFGLVPREDLVDILHVADIFVQPGKDDDFNRFRLPAKIPEFLSVGRPTILPRSNIGNELDHGVEALITTEGTAEEIMHHCLLIAGDPELARKLGERGQAFARDRFAPEVVAGSADAIYQSALGGRARVSPASFSARLRKLFALGKPRASRRP